MPVWPLSDSSSLGVRMYIVPELQAMRSLRIRVGGSLGRAVLAARTICIYMVLSRPHTDVPTTSQCPHLAHTLELKLPQ
jgi:hypothetical protein